MTTHIFAGAGQAGNWADPNNWVNGVPGTTDTAFFGAGPNETINSSMAVGNLMAIGSQTLTFTGVVTSYGNGPCTGVMVCVGATLDFVPGSTLDDEAKLIVGVAAVGTFDATGTAADPTTINAGNITLGKNTAGTGNMTVDHATVNTQCIWDGFVGNGNLTITDGSRVNVSSNVVEACTAGDTATLTLTNGGDLAIAGGAVIGGISPYVAAGIATVSIAAGTSMTVQGGVHVEAGSTVTVSGGTFAAGMTGGYLVVMAGALLQGNGLITTTTHYGVEADFGTIVAQGGTLQIDGTIIGTGTMQIDADSTLAITGRIINPLTIDFVGSHSILSIAHGANIQAELSGFGFGDQIVTTGVSSATWSAATGSLTLFEGSQNVDTLHLAGSYAGDIFKVSQSHGASVITVQAAPAH
jgi:hypothetical protein